MTEIARVRGPHHTVQACRTLLAVTLALALVAPLLAQPATSPGAWVQSGTVAVRLAPDLVARELCELEVDDGWFDALPPKPATVEPEGGVGLISEPLRVTSDPGAVRLQRAVHVYPDEALVTWRAEATDGERHRVRVGLSLPVRPLEGAACNAWVFSGRAGQQMQFALSEPDSLPAPLNSERSHNLNMGLHSLIADVDPRVRFDLDGDADGRWQLYREDDELRLVSLHWRVGPERPLVAVARIRIGAGGAPRPASLADLVKHAVSITASLDQRGLYFDRQPVELRLDALALEQAAEERTAAVTVTHQDGAEVVNTSVKVLPAGLREHRASLSIDPPRRGMYRVHVGAGELRRELTFGVVPRPSRVGGAEDSVFGIHAILRNPHFPRLAEQMGMRWERLWGGNISNATLWYAVEPEPGIFEWRDEQIDLAREHELSILGMLGGRSPQWLETPMVEWGDEELSAWRRYVRATVAHYRGRISHWEVLNEPYGGLRPDQADVYVRVLRAAWEAAKQANPDCVIVGVCGPPSAAHWYEPVFEAGGLRYLDAVSAHLYPPGGGTAVLDFDEELRRQIAGIRELMREYGEVKPLWDTEAGIGPATPFNRMRQPRYFSTYGRPVPIDVATDMTARLYIVHAAEHVRMFYYLLHGSYEYAYALCENDGSPLPACAALAVAESILDGARPVASVANGPARSYAFRRGDRGVIAVWGVGLQGRRPTLAAELSPDEALDVMGNPAAATDADGRLALTLTPSPVYLRMPASRLAEAIESLESAPEPELAPIGVQITGVHDELLGEYVALDVHGFEAHATEMSVAFEELPAGWQAVEREGYGREGDFVIHGGRRLLFPIERAADAERAGTVAARVTCDDAVVVATDTVELPDRPPPPGRPHRPGVEMSHTGVEQVTVGRWTVQTSRSGLQTLYAGDRPLLEHFYFYVARHGLNQALVSFRGSERTTERSPDGASVVLSNETDRGSCRLTVRPTEDEVRMRWELHVEPVETGWGELGVYVPESILNRGYPCELEATLANGQTRERVLSAENHPMDALDHVQALGFRHPGAEWSIELGGFDFAGAHGWHFQDHRDNARRPGLYRLVLSFAAEEGFDADVTMTVRGDP